MDRRLFKKKYLLLLALIFFTSCGVRGKEPVISDNEMYRYTIDKMHSEEDVFRGVQRTWCCGASRCFIGTVGENTELWRYDLEASRLSKTVLSMGDMYFAGGITDGYVDSDGALHTLCMTKNKEVKQSYYFCTFDVEGSITAKIDVTAAIHSIAEEYPYGQRIIFLPNGKIFFWGQDDKKNSWMFLLFDDGEVKVKEKLGRITISAYHVCGDEKMWIVEGPSSYYKRTYSLSVVNLNNGTRKVLINNLPESDSGNYWFVEGNDVQKVYYQTDEAFWEYDEKNNKLNKVFSFSDLSLDGRFVNYISQCPDGSWRILYVNQVETSFDFLQLHKTEERTSENIRTELTYAVVGPKQMFMSDVNAFNYSQNQVKIVVKEYENADLLLADVLSGKVPDLVDLGETMICSALEKKELLEDLGVYLERDGELSREDFLANALEIYGRDEKIYAIPYGVTISAMMGDKNYLGGRENWDLQQFRDFLDSMSDGERATGGCFDQEILVNLCYQYLNRFVDVGQSSCNFQTTEFEELLEISALFPNLNVSEEIWNKRVDDILSGENILTCISIGDITTFEYWRTLFQGKGRIIGYPSVNGNGVGIQTGGIAPAMTENCRQKDAAWEFIKATATKEKEGVHTMMFPAYKPLLNEMFEEARLKAELEEEGKQILYENSMMDIPPASISEIEELKQILDSGEVIKGGDEKIIQIISEEASAYFAGERNAEKIAEIIQNRVTLYLDE